MSDSPEGLPEDFEVYPSSRDAAAEFTAALSSLKKALKPADAKPMLDQVRRMTTSSFGLPSALPTTTRCSIASMILRKKPRSKRGCR